MPDFLVHLVGISFDETSHQVRNILGPLSQRRQHDRKNIQAIKQIRTKLIVFDHATEITMRRGNQAHIHADSACASQALELLLLQHAQKLRL